ncbi:hypothetical protein RIVM261_053310 [Rivularia sp. IAM M-261]|nr:hypothetical protein RIVM261_053310 [Rivularia sp. IAM M-261]
MLAQLIKTKILLRGKSSQKLLQLPVMTNPETITVLRICNFILFPAYFCSQSLMALLIFLSVQKSLQQGNSIWSSSFYTVYSIILSNLQELALQAYFDRLSKRERKVIATADDPDFEAKIQAAIQEKMQMKRES